MTITYSAQIDLNLSPFNKNIIISTKVHKIYSLKNHNLINSQLFEICFFNHTRIIITDVLGNKKWG